MQFDNLQIKQLETEILSEEALEFVFQLAEHFSARIDELLQERKKVQQRILEGALPTFPPETKHIREGEWQVAPYPEEVADRRIEITGPVDRKMVINALNSGANVFMADFEDSNSPTWENCIQGQKNLMDAVRRTISFEAPNGKKYELKEDLAILFVRPRGLHLVEKHLVYQGKEVPASLVDFGLYFFHNAKELVKRGTHPYFYIPKLQSYQEARLWDDIFTFSEKYVGLPHGTIKATVLIEHILAAYQMDEILYELKDHSLGLNCGRWDYIFSFIKTFAHRDDFVLPDRSQVTMDKGFLKAYVDLLIKTCHRRGTFAMGGMAAQIPIKADPEANKQALDKVYQDKLREVKAGHDGTWIAHPGLLEIARKPFDEYMHTPNQIHVKRDDVEISEADLIQIPAGQITEEGVRVNISVGIQYLMNWLAGNGCVAINYLMEDAATAEISRAQLWQWLYNKVTLADGRVFDRELFETMLEEETRKIAEGNILVPVQKLELARELFRELTLKEQIEEFLTIPAYELLVEEENL